MPDIVPTKLAPVEGNPFTAGPPAQGSGLSAPNPLASVVEMVLGGPVEIATHAARAFSGDLLFPGERHHYDDRRPEDRELELLKPQRLKGGGR